MALVTYRTSHDWGIPGQVGTLAYRFLGDDESEIIPRTTAGIVEYPTGSGRYAVDVPNFDEAWNGQFWWDDGSIGESGERVRATAAGTATTAAVPATRTLEFEYRTGSPAVLTDVTSAVLSDPTATFGARRQDTAAVVVADGTAMTHDGTGRYSYEIPENGYTLEYWVEYVVGGVTRWQKFYSFPTSIHYANRVDIEREIGKDNTLLYADPQSNQLPEDVAATIEDSLDFADDLINSRLGGAGYTLPLVALTGKSIPTTLLRTIARKLAAWQLYQIRGMGDDKLDGKFKVKYDWAVAELQQLIDDGLVGVAEQVAGGGNPLVDLAGLSPAGAGLNDQCGTDCTCARYNYLGEPVLTP